MANQKMLCRQAFLFSWDDIMVCLEFAQNIFIAHYERPFIYYGSRMRHYCSLHFMLLTRLSSALFLYIEFGNGALPEKASFLCGLEHIVLSICSSTLLEIDQIHGSLTKIFKFRFGLSNEV